VPRVGVVIYARDDGTAPLLEALQQLRRSGQHRVVAKCRARILLLSEKGPELRRPVADYLADGIYELRVRHERVHYRMLYFFAGPGIVVLSHLITKLGRVPGREIERAHVHRKRFLAKPDLHTHSGDWQED
jgi:phage-related protein